MSIGKVQYIKVLIFFILLGIGKNLGAQFPPFVHLDQTEGLASDQIFTFIQDGKGYYWFCSSNGVFKFDGKNSIQYTTEEGLGDNINYTILEDSNGGIWLGGFNGTVSYIYKGEIYNSVKDGWLIPANHRAKNDVLWESEGHVCFRKGRKNFYTVKLAKNIEDYVFNESFPIKKGGSFFINGNEYYHLTQNAIVRMPPSAEPDTLYSHDGILRGFKYLNKDSILFFNDRNHIILANAKGETELLDIFHKNIKFLNYSQGHIVLIDTEGSLYLFDFVKGTWFKPFKNQSIKKALFDQDGSLVCVSNSTGLLLVPQIKAQSYTYDGGYDFRNAYAIYAKDEHIWLGTQRSTVHKINRSGTIETRAINDRKLSNIINVIKEVNDEVYIGSERTIIRLREDGNEEEYEVHALKDFEVFENDLIVAQFNGIRRIPLDSREKIDTLFEERCFATVKLSEEQMLFHAKSGLYTYTLSSNKVEEFACNEDFSNQRITEIEFVNGTLLFGTNGAGLWVFDGKTMRKFKKKDGLCDNFIYDIHLDNLENIWLATSNGVNQISLRQRQVNVIKHFDTSDGLLNAFCHRIYGTQDKIYVTGPEGLSILNVEQDVDRIFIGQKKIVFGKVKVNNAYVACADLNEVQPGSQIEIPFSFSSIAHAHDFIYEYKEAKDNDFKVLGGNVLELLDLNGRSEPYEYTVRLNYKGKALPETVNSISFTMKPFWYERAWLQILFTIMALSFLFYLIFKRIQKDRLQKERALEIKNQLTQLEMQALQAQFNPHFVHNVLNAIQNFVLKNQPEDAYNYITNFSRLMRNYLNATDDHFISLEREFEMMENYIKLEQIRLPGKFEYKIEFEEGLDASDILIPSMIIQPYIENAIHHGLAHKKQKGLLQLTISKDEEGFKLSVIDNGIGRRAAGEIMANKEKLRKSFGVKIISDRIELFNKLYDQTIHVKIIDLNDTRTGTHVIISIPNLE